jgi:hypothetical protein
MDRIDELTSSAETAGIKIPQYPESNIKRHDLQIICGNSQAEAVAAAIIDKILLEDGENHIEYIKIESSN